MDTVYEIIQTLEKSNICNGNVLEVNYFILGFWLFVVPEGVAYVDKSMLSYSTLGWLTAMYCSHH